MGRNPEAGRGPQAPASRQIVLRGAVHAILVVALYGTAAVAIFQPLFRDPAHTVRHEALAGPDTRLNIWALAWVWHALTTEPSSLFHGNIFYPAPYALCGSEHMFGHQLVFGPIYALSGNPVLGHQLNLLLSFAFCGAAMYALLRHWRADVFAALFGGFVYAFAPIRSYGMEHAQLLATQYLPLALLCLDGTLLTGRAYWAAGFGLCLTVQMLTSYYVAYMALIALGGYGMGIVCSGAALRRRGVALAVFAALAACGMLAGVSRPYLRLRALGVIPDFAAEEPGLLVQVSSGFWRNFLLPPIALREWGYKLEQGVPSYVGLIPLAMALVALAPGRRMRESAARWAPWAALGVTLACYLFALGPRVRLFGRTIPMPYALALQWVPGFSSMRVPSRFGHVLMLGLAALAGLGLSRLLGLIRSPAARRVVGGAVLAVLSLATAWEYDLLGREFRYRRVCVPPVYKALAELVPGPVLEIPAGSLREEAERWFSEAEATLYSAFHWRPLLNGISGYAPLSYPATMTVARRLPDPHATRLLVRLTGLRYVIVHSGRLPSEERARWLETEAFRLLGTFGTDLLLEVRDPPPADLLPRLINFDRQEETVLGTPLVAVPESERRAGISLVRPAPMAVGAQRAFTLELEIKNRSRATWPALAAVRDEKLVTIAYRFESDDGRLVSQQPAAARMPYDLEPGDSVRVAVRVRPPGPGLSRRLWIGLAQNGVWFPDPLGPLPINVTP